MKYLLVLLLFSPMPSAFAEVLRNQILRTDSSTSLQTQGLCHGFAGKEKGGLCLPWSSPLQDGAGLSFALAVKADEEGILAVKRVTDKEIDGPFIDKLFRKQNFLDASAVSRLQILYKGFSVTAVPLHAIGAFKIDNPALPEFHLIAMTEKGGTLSYTVLFNTSFGSWLIAPQLNYSERILQQGDFNALDLAVKPVKDLLEKKEQVVIDGDLALGYYSSEPALPSILLRASRIGTKDIQDGRQYFDLNEALDLGTSASVFWNIPHPIGYSMIGLVSPFTGAFEKIIEEKVAGSYVYKLSRLAAFASISESQNSFGFDLDGSLYKIGIQYTQEKFPQAFASRPRAQTYLSLGFSL